MYANDSAYAPGWTPQPGPQTDFVDSGALEVIYGGARGGGKTDALLGDFARHAAKWSDAAQGLLVARMRVALEPTVQREFPWCATDVEGLRSIFSGYTVRKRAQHLLDFEAVLGWKFARQVHQKQRFIVLKFVN